MRAAEVSDVALLVEMMDEFYAEGGYELNLDHARQAFRSVVADPSLGRIWILASDEQDAGYMVMTFKFAMEYGGTSACLDDLYVRREYRNLGLSTAALKLAVEECRKLGVRSISVEVGYDNGPAQKVYRRAGFLPLERQLMAVALDAPSHLSGPGK